MRERENVVIRVFILVDGVCKSCPGLTLGASVEVLVIRAVNECLKWVFLLRGVGGGAWVVLVMKH